MWSAETVQMRENMMITWGVGEVLSSPSTARFLRCPSSCTSRPFRRRTAAPALSRPIRQRSDIARVGSHLPSSFGVHPGRRETTVSSNSKGMLPMLARWRRGSYKKLLSGAQPAELELTVYSCDPGNLTESLVFVFFSRLASFPRLFLVLLWVLVIVYSLYYIRNSSLDCIFV